MKSVKLLVAITVAMAVLAGAGRVRAQTPTSQYFPQTGHTVQGDFLRFFNTHGGLEIFGYPLTEAFVENGRLVQYLQRARMEARPESQAPYQVQLGLLALELGYADGPISAAQIPPANDPNRRYFSQTGHTASYAFLRYFDEHGGLDIFGYPITEFKLENERIVQYFQRARMEWHPELPEDQRVQLGNLGEVYATTRLDPSLLQPGAATLAPNTPPITSLRLTASPRWAITGSTGQQTLYVYVLDQRNKPVQGASAAAILHFPSGDQSVTFPATDADGHTQITFNLNKLTPGQAVTIRARASWATLVAETRTLFFVWW